MSILIPDWAEWIGVEKTNRAIEIVFFDSNPIQSVAKEYVIYSVPAFMKAHGIAFIKQQIREKPLSERIEPEAPLTYVKPGVTTARTIIDHPEQRSHYHKAVKAINCECGRQHRVYIDVYAVLRAFKVKSHEVGHAIKKLLAAGTRGAKDYKQDIAEAGQSIEAEKRSIDDWG